MFNSILNANMFTLHIMYFKGQTTEQYSTDGDQSIEVMKPDTMGTSCSRVRGDRVSPHPRGNLPTQPYLHEQQLENPWSSMHAQEVTSSTLSLPNCNYNYRCISEDTGSGKAPKKPPTPLPLSTVETELLSTTQENICPGFVQRHDSPVGPA